jgi:hypothetical protein
MVPVIATILDNYIKVVDRCREKADEAKKKALSEQRLHHRSSEHRSSHIGASFGNRPSRFDAGDSRSSRRQPPPPSIDTAATYGNSQVIPGSADAMDITPTGPQFAVTSPPERTTFASSSGHRHPHRHVRGQEARPSSSRHNMQPLATSIPISLLLVPISQEAPDGFILPPVRDVHRLPSMLPEYHSGLTSQPESPTTPLPPAQLRSPTVRPSSTSATPRPRRRPSIRQQNSMGGDQEDPNADSMASDESGDPDVGVSTANDIQSAVNIQDITMEEEGDSMLTAVDAPLGLNTPTISDAQDAETFNITHRSAMDGSIINDATTPRGPPLGFSPAQTNLNATPPTMPTTTIPRYLLDRPTNGQVLAAMPRDEDVLMSLQLLAYVSKYCNLRTYFQKSHLVPKLKIGSELHLLDLDESSSPSATSYPSACDSEEEEYLLPDDFNIFPLVEKFTVRHHTQDMQYWAGVVMRNLCRKDDSRGGIRQCAYYQCGKWEEFTRQFAKCRRCRRTKYCSKECQKSAWVFHRHWCVAATP